MKHNPNKHHRRSIRLQGYDYSSPGAYFITICTQNRESLFGDVVDGEMVWNAYGKIVHEEWFRSAEIRAEIELLPDEFVIMPNHIHGIVWIVGSPHTVRPTDGAAVGATGRSPLPSPLPRGPANHSLASLIAGFKSAVAKRINEHRGTPGAPVWQRNYYEHIIGTDESLRRIRRYIAENPLRWHLDRENPRRTGKDDLWNRLFPEPRNAGQI